MDASGTPDGTPAGAVDPVDAVTAALARLRGGRGPRPQWLGGPEGRDGSGRQRGHERGNHDHEHEHGEHGSHIHHQHGPWGPGEHGVGAHDPGTHEGGGRGAAGHAAGVRFAMAARFRLLEALAAASTPLSVSELADAIGVDQPRASRLVQAAVAAGHVRRDADPDDARRSTLHLTDAGRALASQTRGSRRASVESALAEFSSADREQLAALLTRVADAWPR